LIQPKNLKEIFKESNSQGPNRNSTTDKELSYLVIMEKNIDPICVEEAALKD